MHPVVMHVEQGLSYACQEVDNILFDNRTELTDEDRARVLIAIRDARQDLQATFAALEAELAARGPGKFIVDGQGEVAVRKSIKRTGWDNHALTAVVVARALDERIIDPETGAAEEPSHETVARVLSECARPSWRVTPLRERGIDVSEYCSEEPAALSVQLPPRADV